MTEPRAERDAELEAACESTEQFRYLANHVVGVVDTLEELTPAVAALNDAGFLDSEIIVSCGHATADVIAASTGRRGLAHVAIRIAERLGVSNEEMAIKDRYEQALRGGRFLVAVSTPTDERTELAAQTLKAHGGHFIHYLRRFSLETIHPERR